MKKIIFFVLAFILALTGCSGVAEQTKENVTEEKFIVNSMRWGTSWQDAQKVLENYKIAKEDSNRVAIEIEKYTYLGVNGKLMMEFSVAENSFPAAGFTQAYFVYDEGDEEILLNAGEREYGERKNFFLDKNGVENPLNPPAWYSSETLEESLSEEEMDAYRKVLDGKDIEPTRMDAIMRGPLVVISVSEEINMVRFQGDKAAIVENLRK